MPQYTIREKADLIEYLKDESLSIDAIGKKLKRTTPSVIQKLTEIALEQIERGEDPETVMKNTRARKTDIELLRAIPDPNTMRIKELVAELNVLVQKLR